MLTDLQQYRCEWTSETSESGEDLLVWNYLNSEGNRMKREVAVLCDWNGKDDTAKDRAFLLEHLNAANRIQVGEHEYRLDLSKPITAFACNPGAR
jgi:hypothetical protein